MAKLCWPICCNVLAQGFNTLHLCSKWCKDYHPDSITMEIRMPALDLLCFPLAILTLRRLHPSPASHANSPAFPCSQYRPFLQPLQAFHAATTSFSCNQHCQFMEPSTITSYACNACNQPNLSMQPLQGFLSAITGLSCNQHCQFMVTMQAITSFSCSHHRPFMQSALPIHGNNASLFMASLLFCCCTLALAIWQEFMCNAVFHL